MKNLGSSNFSQLLISTLIFRSACQLLTPHKGLSPLFFDMLFPLQSERSASCLLLFHNIFIYYQEFWINMIQKVAAITGGHKGLGYAIARQLAQQENIRSVLMSRQEQDGLAAQQRLSSENIQVDSHALDVTITVPRMDRSA
jgi:hypothetical protein